MIFQNVATYSYICTYVLNAQPCIVWEGKMFIEYIIHTQEGGGVVESKFKVKTVLQVSFSYCGLIGHAISNIELI